MYTVSEWLLCVGGATLLLHRLISKWRVSKLRLCLPKHKIGIACDFWRWLQLPWFPFWTVDEKQEAARGQAVFRNYTYLGCPREILDVVAESVNQTLNPQDMPLITFIVAALISQSLTFPL